MVPSSLEPLRMLARAQAVSNDSHREMIICCRMRKRTAVTEPGVWENRIKKVERPFFNKILSTRLMYISCLLL